MSDTHSKPDDGIVVPDSLVTETAVAAALAIDEGDDAVLSHWELEDFTIRGDGYSSAIRSLKFSVTKNNTTLDKMYVVKINPLRPMEAFKEFTHTIFVKEAKFYQTLLPDLNAALVKVGQKVLRFPKCYYANIERDKEIIIMEDLRDRGFIRYDRSKSLDMQHTKLILRELARLHAASLLITPPDNPLTHNHSYLLKDWMTHNPANPECLVPMFHGYLKQGKELLTKVGGYEAAIAWIDSLMPRVRSVLEEQLASNSVSVVCHGDCWTNNVLFRYGPDGTPAEVMLLDLQLVRYASPATDLNLLLYTSLTSDLRQPNLDDLLTYYLDTFSEVMAAEGRAPPFDGPQLMTTERRAPPFNGPQLMKEFRAKNVYGAIFAIIVVPIVLLGASEVPDLEEAKDIGEVMEEFKQNTRIALDKNPLLRPRLLSLFDELIEVGVIPTEG